MLGNGSKGAGSLVNHGRTGVIQGYSGASGATAKKSKKGQVDEGNVDRIDRDGQGNQMLVELIDPREERRQGDVLCPAGHSPGVRWVDGDAFRTDAKGRTVPPAFADVDQGNLGDSWLMASLAAVAHSGPQHLLKRCDKVRGDDDQFRVRLGSFDMYVSPEFSAEGYADPLPNGMANTLWVALFEKAFAKRAGNSYANLEIGNPNRALEMLTGKPSRRTSIHAGTSLSKLVGVAREAKKAGRAMVLVTRESGVSSPLHPEHAYAVLDVYEKGSEWIAKVYNPWGTNGGKRSVESIIYEVKLDDVRANCAMLCVSGG